MGINRKNCSPVNDPPRVFGRLRMRELLFVIALAVLTVHCHAEEVGPIRIQQGPYYVGEPFVLQVPVSGLQESQQVECTYSGDTSSSLTITAPETSRSSSSFMSFVNGQMSRRESIELRHNFQVTPLSPGTHSVGPFVVSVDGEEQTLREITIEALPLEEDKGMEISLTIPDGKFFVGQQIPVTIRWAFAGKMEEVQHAYQRLQIRSPLFDQFEFRDAPITSRTTMAINSSSGTQEINAQVSQEQRGNEQYVVVTGVRNLVANKPGQFDDIGISCRTQRVTRWRRDFFDVVAAASKPAIAKGEPIGLSIQALPEQGKPKSFAGAVGSGFSMDVQANRSVVRIGDPIAIDLKIRGDGDIETLVAPNLVGAGFDDNLFQLPTEPLSGTLNDGWRQFKLNVRVKDEAVTQIPALEFSWFNPSTENYETTKSKPIALQVMETQRVTADNIVTNTPLGRENEDKTQSDRSTPASSARLLTGLGANLAIENDVTHLVGTGGLSSVPFLVPSLYALGALLVCCSLLVQAMGKRSTKNSAHQSLIREFRSELRNAAQQPPTDSAETTAKVLRRAIAAGLLPAAVRPQADQLLAQCEQLSYAPHGDQGKDSAQLAAEAGEIIDRLGE